jgi:propanediol utilization protein
MNLHRVTYIINDRKYTEFSSSAAGAASIRARVKKEGKIHGTSEIEVATTRAELIAFLNSLTAHESHIPPAVANHLTEG